MKKIIAILIALMMLTLPMALAETIVTVSDPVVSATLEGEPMTIDLTGLQIVCAAGTIGETAAAQIDFIGNGSKLYGVAVNVQGNRVVLAPQGLSNVYYVEIPVDTADLEGLELPDLDMEAVASALLSGIEAEGDTIRIPYTAINDALALLAPQLEGIQIMGVDGSEVAQALEQLKESDSGITLEGSYAEDESGISISGKGILVQNGQAGEAIFDMDLAIGDEIAFSIDLMGQTTMYFKTEGERFTVGGSAEGNTFELSAAVTTEEGTPDLTEIDASNAIDITTLDEAQTEALSTEAMTAASGLLMFVIGALGAAA